VATTERPAIGKATPTTAVRGASRPTFRKVAGGEIFLQMVEAV